LTRAFFQRGSSKSINMYLIHQWISSVSQIKMRLPGPAPISTPVFLVGCFVDSLKTEAPGSFTNCHLQLPTFLSNPCGRYQCVLSLRPALRASHPRHPVCSQKYSMPVYRCFLGQLGMLICNGVRKCGR